MVNYRIQKTTYGLVAPGLETPALMLYIKQPINKRERKNDITHSEVHVYLCIWSYLYSFNCLYSIKHIISIIFYSKNPLVVSHSTALVAAMTMTTTTAAAVTVMVLATKQ